MNFAEDISQELDKIHANHQLRKITTAIADEIDMIKAEQTEIKERLFEIEEKGGDE